MQQASGVRLPQQPNRRFLQRGEVRNRGQFQGPRQIGELLQLGGDAAVVSFEERLENEAGEQLRLRDLLGAALVGVEGKGVCTDGQRLTGDAQGRFSGNTHTALYERS